jgi:hypothetical protein
MACHPAGTSGTSAATPHASYNYVLNENGQTVQYGSRPEDCLGDVLTGKAVQVIRSSAGAGQPFFLCVLPFNPHSASVAAPWHEGMFAEAELPRPPSFQRGRCERQAGLHPPAATPQLETDRLARVRVPKAHRNRSRRSTIWSRASSRRLPRPAARQHLRHLYLR